MTPEQHTIESDNDDITAAVGGPWVHDDTMYSWLATPGNTLVRFQWREQGAVLEVAGETICWKDARTPAGPSPPTGLQDGIDVASYQDADLTWLIHTLDPNPTHVIVRLYQERESPPQSHSITQIQTALACGATVAGYVWLYADVDGGDSADEALDLAESIGLVLPILWLDVETYPDGSYPSISNTQRAVDACVARGYPVGVYTGRWFWKDYYGDTHAFAHLPLWHAEYPGYCPTKLTPVDYGGFGTPKIQQWTSSPCDRNIVDSSVTIR